MGTQAVGTSASGGAEYLGPPRGMVLYGGWDSHPPPQVPMRVSTCVDARNVPDQPQDSASVTVPSMFWGVPGCRVGLTHTGWWWWAMLSPRPGTRGR